MTVRASVLTIACLGLASPAPAESARPHLELSEAQVAGVSLSGPQALDALRVHLPVLDKCLAGKKLREEHGLALLTVDSQGAIRRVDTGELSTGATTCLRALVGRKLPTGRMAIGVRVALTWRPVELDIHATPGQPDPYAADAVVGRLTSHLGIYRACYLRERNETGVPASGTVEVALGIDEAGRVTRVTVERSFHTGVDACITRLLRALPNRFTPADAPRTAHLRFRFAG